MELALIVILKSDSKNIRISIKGESLDVMDEFLAQNLHLEHYKCNTVQLGRFLLYWILFGCVQLSFLIYRIVL